MLSTEKIFIYDTTLRDGSQAEGIAFSKNDKLRIAARLDKLGAAYIEGGWPGSNPKDIEFFREAAKLKLKNAKITAFGSTRRADRTPETDENLGRLLEAETPVVTIFGKASVLHIREVLHVSKKENLDMIAGSCAFLSSHGREVIFDAEHFFDGFAEDEKYTLSTIITAANAGASTIVLCDTNGGSLPESIYSATRKAREVLPATVTLGIHCHNDSELAVANSLEAVRAGARHIQGTLNGFGERCGNANLCSIIPNLELKMNFRCLPSGMLKDLRNASRFIDETANLNHNPKLPYVGESAFAHKGGMHVNAVEKKPLTFEHIDPALVGNQRRILVSELSGRSNLAVKAKELHIDATPELLARALAAVKEKENLGYEYELAEASLALLIDGCSDSASAPFFTEMGYRVSVEKRGPGDRCSQATVKVKVGDETSLVAAESTSGPVNALDLALRKALTPFYPGLKKVSLLDYKVRILGSRDGTAAKTRVLIESVSGKRSAPWVTVGLSENIIDASWEAIVESVNYFLMMNRKKGKI